MAFFIVFLIVASSASFAQGPNRGGSLRGQVTDPQRRLILNARLTLVDSTGTVYTATTVSEGGFRFGNLTPGHYKLTAEAPGFARYSNPDVLISPGGRHILKIQLDVQPSRARVVVRAEGPLSVEPEENANAVIWREQQLQVLPQQGDALLSALNAAAGPPPTQSDREVLVDGFSGNRVPPTQSVRTIRVGSNPFAAEYERMGDSRVEVSTKPGTGKSHATGYFNFNDGRFNSRNPFATNKVRFQLRQFGGNASGPLVVKRISYFVDFDKREADDNAVVNATVLDSALRPSLFNRAILTPQRRITLSPRLDLQFSPRNTATARYRFFRSMDQNRGIGGFSLPSRGYTARNVEQSLQLSDTLVPGQNIVINSAFQLIHQDNRQTGDISVPTTAVLDAFTGGGSQIGDSFTRRTAWEFQSQVYVVQRNHGIKFGGRLRGVAVRDVATSNFGGTYTFGGSTAVRLDASDQVDLSGGAPIFQTITSLERYRRTLAFLQNGLPSNRGSLSNAQLGFGPTQFSVAGGNPEAQVRQLDLGLFIQDDWRARENLTLSFGLRYEAQSNVSDHSDFAPRFSVAWSPKPAGGNKTPKMVIRAGAGIFYERFPESYTLQSHRLDGKTQQQFNVTDPAILSLYPRVPTVETLTAFSVPQSVRVVAPDLRAPYSFQTSVGIERQLPRNNTVTVTWLRTKSLHLLRSRNINSPLVSPTGSLLARPNPIAGNIFQYESSGDFRLNQIRAAVNSRLWKRLSIASLYVWTHARSDTDGASSFPAYSYDLKSEMGRASTDIRHTFTLNGTFDGPFKLRLSPFLVASSGRPFNITTGRDSNGDTVYTERPAFATNTTPAGSLLRTAFGDFDVNPRPDQALVPRNFATGPAFFLFNLRLSRSFKFGEAPRGGAANNKSKARKMPDRSTSPLHWLSAKTYTLNLAVQVQNVLNNTNLGLPTGNLRSSYFGRSNGLATGYGYGDAPSSANRRIEFQMQLAF